MECLLLQVQKTEVRNNILQSALDEFFECGFRDASIRRIAHRAGVTPGNIYAYFSSKKDLFESLLEPTINDISRFVSSFSKDFKIIELHQIAEGITKIFVANKKTFTILLKGSKGTRFENIKQDLFIMVKKRIKNQYLAKSFPKMKDSLSTEAFSISLIEGILYLFDHFNGNEKQLLCSLNHFIMLSFGERI